MGMQPYVIKIGDYVALLAYQFGFDADTVWNDPANDALRQLRPDPNVLCPTDILYIPDQNDKQPAMQTLTTGQANNFVANSQMVTVSVHFSSCICFACEGQPLKGEAYEVEGASVDPGALDDDGNFTATIPTSTQEFTVKLTNRNEMYTIKVGYLDPPATLTGAWQRLAMLGFTDSPTLVSEDGYDDGITPDVQYALWEFQWSNDIPMTAVLDGRPQGLR
jgi:hypothetical protein